MISSGANEILKLSVAALSVAPFEAALFEAALFADLACVDVEGGTRLLADSEGRTSVIGCSMVIKATSGLR